MRVRYRKSFCVVMREQGVGWSERIISLVAGGFLGGRIEGGVR